MGKRLLTIYLAFVIAVNLMGLPLSPFLVCRFTGERMAVRLSQPDAPTVEANRCCAVRTQILGDGSPTYELSAPSCCDLKQAYGHDIHPWLTIAATDALPAFRPIVSLPPPIFVEQTIRRAVTRSSAPRAPPPREIQPRGPPLFS